MPVLATVSEYFSHSPGAGPTDDVTVAGVGRRLDVHTGVAVHATEVGSVLVEVRDARGATVKVLCLNTPGTGPNVVPAATSNELASASASRSAAGHVLVGQRAEQRASFERFKAGGRRRWSGRFSTNWTFQQKGRLF